jgi:anti-sigma regulatory factor (Ser/Thr protein kinase)
MDDCLNLESDPHLVAVAREFVRSRLVAWELADLVDDAVLVASELVTNAVLHARTAIQLRLQCKSASLRVEVFDENPRLPMTPSCPPEATSGRGLALVSKVAGSWGIEHRDEGKAVWAELGPSTSWEEPENCLELTDYRTVADAIEQVRGSHPEGAV